MEDCRIWDQTEFRGAIDRKAVEIDRAKTGYRQAKHVTLSD
jgi:hypothetical protein